MLQTATDASAADKTSEANQENRIATTRQCPFPSGALAVNSPAQPDRMGLGSGVPLPVPWVVAPALSAGADSQSEPNAAQRQDRKPCAGADLSGTTALAACEPQAPGDGVLSRGAQW